MNLAALLLLLQFTTRPIDETVGSCHELVFKGDEVYAAIRVIQQSSGRNSAPVKVIQGNRVGNIQFEAKPKPSEQTVTEKVGAEAPVDKSNSPQ